MLAVEAVEIHAVCRRVLRAVPPVPIATFGDEQLFKGQRTSLFTHLIFDAIIGLTRPQKVFPGKVVLFGANPDIEIRIDPRGGEDLVNRLCGYLFDRFRYRQSLDLIIAFNLPVKFPQEWPAGQFKIFPGVFAIENDWHQGVAARAQDRGTIGANGIQKMIRSFFGPHARVDKADEVAQRMIAKQPVHLVLALLPKVGTIGQFWSCWMVKGAGEHAVVGGKPLEARRGGEMQCFIRHGPFAWP